MKRRRKQVGIDLVAWSAKLLDEFNATPDGQRGELGKFINDYPGPDQPESGAQPEKKR